MADDYVYFKDLQVHDRRQTLTLERSIRHTAGLAGIHSFSFLNEIEEDGSSVANFTLVDVGATWSSEGGKIKAVGNGGAQWWRAYHTTDIDGSFVATFNKFEARGAFVFCGNASDEYYAAYWTATGVGIGRINSSGALTKSAEFVHSGSINASVTVAVRQQTMTDYDVVDWISIAVYFDGQLMAAGSIYIQGETLGDRIGFAVYDSDTIYFEQLDVPELYHVIEWTSVDPGETCGAGMARAIGTTPVFYYARYDGSLRCWLPGDRSVDWTVPSTRELGRSSLVNRFTPGHVRMVGAYHERDAWNDALLEQQARPTFALLDNPNLVDKDEILEGADEGHRRVREGKTRWSVNVPGNPLIEVHDKLSVDSNDIRILGVQFNVEKASEDEPPTITMQVEGTDFIDEGL